jgi:twitching motility protein PilT
MSSDLALESLIGQLARHYQLVTDEELSQAVVRRKASGGNLGAILVEMGHITTVQLQQILEKREQYVQQRMEQGGYATPPQGGVVTPAPQAAPAQETPAPAIASPASSRSIRDVPGQRPPVDAAKVAWLGELLKQETLAGATDIHLHSGANIKVRRFQQLQEHSDQALMEEDVEGVLLSILSDRELALLEATGQVDFAYAIAGTGRFRVSIYRQHRGLSGVFHFIPAEIRSLPQLGLPETLSKLTAFHNGLILVTGPVGCGKTSTLAALVDLVNQQRAEHILTIEDPIEYLHPAKNCIVSQRQVGPHTDSFTRALRAALREDPDVIAIGELRDRETISLAMSAAETGHLVIGTLHTNSAIRTINRIVGTYPPSQQGQIRSMLSESLRAVISQRLLPSADGQGVALALEVLMLNRAVGSLIRDNKTFQIYSVMQTGASKGMVLLDSSLQQLVQAGRITREVAAENAENPKLFA